MKIHVIEINPKEMHIFDFENIIFQVVFIVAQL